MSIVTDRQRAREVWNDWQKALDRARAAEDRESVLRLALEQIVALETPPDGWLREASAKLLEAKQIAAIAITSAGGVVGVVVTTSVVPPILTFKSQGSEVLSIRSDGRVVLNPEIPQDEAVRAFCEALTMRLQSTR